MNRTPSPPPLSIYLLQTFLPAVWCLKVEQRQWAVPSRPLIYEQQTHCFSNWWIRNDNKYPTRLTWDVQTEDFKEQGVKKSFNQVLVCHSHTGDFRHEFGSTASHWDKFLIETDKTMETPVDRTGHTVRSAAPWHGFTVTRKISYRTELVLHRFFC